MWLSASALTSAAGVAGTSASGEVASLSTSEPAVAWPWQEEAVEKVAWAISEDAVFPPDMGALCAVAGMSPMHLERAFRLCFGVSLKSYAQAEWQKRLQSEREQRCGGGYACGHERGVAREWLIAAI